VNRAKRWVYNGLSANQSNRSRFTLPQPRQSMRRTSTSR
jgi:hypothetical protein